MTESLLGIRLDIDKLRFAPRLPANWSSCKLHYRYRDTFFHITILKKGAGLTVQRIVLDGADQPDQYVQLVDDRNAHNADVEVG